MADVYLILNGISIPAIMDMSENDNPQGDESITASGTTRVDRPTQQVLTEITARTLPMTLTDATILRNIIKNNLMGAITVESDFSTEEKTYFLKRVNWTWDNKNGFNQDNTFHKGARVLEITLAEKGDGL